MDSPPKGTVFRYMVSDLILGIASFQPHPGIPLLEFIDGQVALLFQCLFY